MSRQLRTASARHRAARRRRTGSLLTALALTAIVGVSAVVVTPQLKGAPQAAVASAAIQTASLDEVQAPEPSSTPTPTAKPLAAPADSGEGRRIVFDQSDQRVWLVGDDGEVDRTYPVSGSRFDNLKPGSYAVQSRSRHATAFDASGTMEYFVRFATGYSEPIGFHTVPIDNDGKPEQTKAQLGTPLSAGCVRQWRDDAIALWDFAPVGTPVVVTA